MHRHGGDYLHLWLGWGVHEWCAAMSIITIVIIMVNDMFNGRVLFSSFFPCTSGHFVELVDGQGIEEFMGEVDGGATSGHLCDMAMPKHLGLGCWEKSGAHTHNTRVA